MDFSDFEKAMDYRAFMDSMGDITLWRIYLRKTLYNQRKGLSDLTRKPLTNGFDLHESVFSRTWLPINRGQGLLFAGVNCMLLSREEHIPYPPDRVTAYWISVVRYGKDLVDKWIDSLPFKAMPSKPWRDSNGAEVLARIPAKYKVANDWQDWYDSVYKKVDCDG